MTTSPNEWGATASTTAPRITDHASSAFLHHRNAALALLSDRRGLSHKEAAIRLAPTNGEVVVCEGLEDGLSLQSSLSIATWATAGTGGMTSLKLPASVRDVIIGADNDEAGETAAQRAAETFVAQGRSVRIIRPLARFKDFNDELRGIER